MFEEPRATEKNVQLETLKGQLNDSASSGDFTHCEKVENIKIALETFSTTGEYSDLDKAIQAAPGLEVSVKNSINTYLRSELGTERYAPPEDFFPPRMQEVARNLVELSKNDAPDSAESLQQVIDGMAHWKEDFESQHTICGKSMELAMLETPERVWSEVGKCTVNALTEYELDYDEMPPDVDSAYSALMQHFSSHVGIVQSFNSSDS